MKEFINNKYKRIDSESENKENKDEKIKIRK